MRDGRPRILLVAGMHRSGTSALARVLSLCGGALPRTLFEAVSGDNDLGYWESAPLIALEQSILDELRTPMLGPDPIASSWFDTARAQHFRGEIIRVLRSEWSGGFPWIVKEPRMCRLMPLWRDVLVELDAMVAVVIPLREPAEVCASLARRDGMRVPCAEQSWLAHVVGAERHTRDFPRCFVTYDQLLADWRTTIGRIDAVVHEALGPEGGLHADIRASEIDRFLDIGLRRHQTHRDPAGALVRAVRDTLFDAAMHADRAPDRDTMDRAWLELHARCA